MDKHFLCLLGAVCLVFALDHKAVSQGLIEPTLIPGTKVPTVRAIVCNRAIQIAEVLKAYSESYNAGRRVFEEKREKEAYDFAADRMAPICDEVWFSAIIPIRTISTKPYNVYFADGSTHLRHIIEVKPVDPDGRSAEASYFISSRWRVARLDTGL